MSQSSVAFDAARDRYKEAAKELEKTPSAITNEDELIYGDFSAEEHIAAMREKSKLLRREKAQEKTVEERRVAMQSLAPPEDVNPAITVLLAYSTEHLIRAIKMMRVYKMTSWRGDDYMIMDIHETMQSMRYGDRDADCHGRSGDNPKLNRPRAGFQLGS
jgi:hypothetical protein